MESVEFILRVRLENDENARELERSLTMTAQAIGGKPSKIVRKEHGTYATHKSRKTLVRP